MSAIGSEAGTGGVDLASRVRQALAAEPRLAEEVAAIGVAAGPDTVVTLDGEVASVARKRIALERAASVDDVVGIVDRLHVRPAARMSDEQILHLVLDALVGEPAFQAIRTKGGTGDWHAQPPELMGFRGEIDVEVADGVVTLNGRVGGLDEKRLAGVLAWWVPGSRDVVNGIAVEPPEDDSDAAIVEAVRLVLEKDRLVDAGQVRVTAKDAVVTLQGFLREEHERHMAESDAWFVFGVDDVVDEIELTTTGHPILEEASHGRDPEHG